MWKQGNSQIIGEDKHLISKKCISLYYSGNRIFVNWKINKQIKNKQTYVDKQINTSKINSEN